ncbi:MAG TPA: ABC transporter substrate-binding protein [Planctomycetota bacterium]|nr:ABC transporter substrate-binding protein [Planctomycetota bacterium]
MKPLLVASLLLAGCGSKDDRPGPRTLLWARGADSTTLDPAQVEWLEDLKINQSLYETLVTFKPDSTELEGRLATAWTVSPDGRSVSFDLRTGVTFHDGSPFDAEAVAYTFQRILDPNHPERPRAVPYAASFSVVEGVKADGPHRAVFTLRTPSAVFLSTLTVPAAAIVSPAAVRKHGTKFAQNPSGTGPYRLGQWDRDVRMVLERFAGYWGKPPAMERVIVLPVASPQTAIQKLRQGEVHVVDHPSLADIGPLGKDPSLRVEVQASMNTCYLGFNLRKFPYSDPDFRRAVSLALDRRLLNTIAYYGLADPAANLVPPAIWGGICATPEYEEDLQMAKECLGRVKLASKEVELIHMTFPRPYLAEPARVAEFVKDRLGRIGLEVKLTAYEKSAYTVKIKEPGHPMYLYGWLADYADPDNFYYPLLHGENAGDLNGSYFDDPPFNDAVKRAQTELDPAKRSALYATAYARYREVMPTLPLVHAKQVVALSRKVRYSPHPIECRFYAASWAE